MICTVIMMDFLNILRKEDSRKSPCVGHLKCKENRHVLETESELGGARLGRSRGIQINNECQLMVAGCI